MKIILLVDTPKVGKKDEIVDVSPGYGMFLVNAGKAWQANEANIKKLNEIFANREKENKQKHDEAVEYKKILEDGLLEFTLKSNKGKMFGSISAKQIEEAIKSKYNITIDKRKFVDDSSINSFGYSFLKIELFKGVVATVKVHVKEAKNG